MNPLIQFNNIPIDFQTIASLYPEYKSPKDKIARLEKEGNLIRLKRGLFVVSQNNPRTRISKELISNHLYGPSYISLQSSLSFYNLIPERVTTMRSMTTKHTTFFNTPFGLFEYIKTNDEYYKIGLHIEIIENQYAFIIATPEKALCDLIITTNGLRIQSRKSMQHYLEDDLRLELSLINRWDLDIIKECILTGSKKTELNRLLEYLERLSI